MAQIVQNVSLANTFGEWVNSTNDTVDAINALYFTNFTKPVGSITLLEPTTAFVVGPGSAVFTGLVDIGGTGGSLLVRHGAEVQNTLYLSNKDGGNQSSVVFTANGVSNTNFLNVVGPGLAANVSNNMYIGGTLTITGNTYASSNLSVTKDITGNNETINYDLNVGQNATINNKLHVLGVSTLDNDLYANYNVMVAGKEYVNELQANTSANTRTLSVTGVTSTDFLQANTAANTRTLSVTGVSYTDFLQANTAANTHTLSVTGESSTNTLQANTSINSPIVNTSVLVTNTIQANASVNTATLSVTGTSTTNTIQANTSLNTPVANVNVLVSNIIQANASVNTRTLSVTGATLTNTVQSNTSINSPIVNTSILISNTLQANASINTATLSITGVTLTNSLQANASVNTAFINTTGNLSAGGTANVNQLTSNTNIVANSGTVFASVVSAPSIRFNTSILGGSGSQITTDTGNFGNLNVTGNFTISGSTVYSSSTFTLRDGVPLLPGTGGYSQYTINRGEGTNTANANASIRWDNTNLYWAVRDVSNPTQYNKILDSTDNTIILNTITTANTNMKNYVDVANTNLRLYTNAQISANATTLNNNIVTANTNLKSYVDVAVVSLQNQISANAVSANAVITTANTNLKSYVDNGFQNSVNGTISTANTNLRLYTDTNIAANVTTLNSTIVTANTNLKSYVDVAVVSLQNQISANAVSANAVITTANTNMKNYVDVVTTSLQNQISANSISSNAVITTANTAMKTYVDNTFLKLSSGTTQTVASDVTVTGNLVINGVTTTVNTTTVETTDSLLKLAKNNTASDTIDIGFYAPYLTGGATRYTGLFRKAADKYYLGQGIVTDPTTNNIANYGINYRATLDANFTGGTVSSLAAPISVSDGGTGLSSLSAGYIPYGNGTSAFSSSSNLYFDGNILGIGVTPSAWSGDKAIQIGSCGAFSGGSGTNAVYVLSNVYYNLGYKYVTSGPASNYYQYNGLHSWGTAASGTAGTSASFTQLMTLNTSGALGFGNSPSYGTTGQLMTSGGIAGLPTWTTSSSTNTNNAVVQRDGSGNFSAGTITATLNGNATNISQYTINQNLGTANAPTFAGLTSTSGLTVTGAITATTTITSYYSDERLKTKLGNIENALEKVKSLNGFYYEANEVAQSLGYSPKREVGVSAQEVENVLPEIVTSAPIDNQYLTIWYERLTPLLIEAIKELSAEVEELKKKIN